MRIILNVTVRERKKARMKEYDRGNGKYQHRYENYTQLIEQLNSIKVEFGNTTVESQCLVLLRGSHCDIVTHKQVVLIGLNI